MEVIASPCLFKPITTTLLVPLLLSCLGGGEALFLHYGYADNICIISARAIERQSLLLLLRIFGWCMHTLCMFVCFLFSFRRSSSPSITKKDSCIEYDYERQRCACICAQLVFLADFLSCFLHLLLLSFSSSTLQSLFICHLVKYTRTKQNSDERKE
jgi:hypothetical protein